MTKENCDQWMTYVYREWLDGLARVEQESYLRTSTRNMIERMRSAATAGNADEAWNRLERLKRLNEGFDSEARIDKYRYEKPESYMECALTAYKLGDLQGALDLFRVSTGDFLPSSAYKAVCHWMVGCVQWQIPSRSESAVLSWERSLQVMGEFVSENLENKFKQNVDEALKQRGRDAVRNMRNAIDLASGNGFPPPPPQASASFNANPGNRGRRTSSASSAVSARLKFLPCFGGIPAGGPSVVDNNPDMIDLDALEIEGKFYNIFEVLGGQEVCMKPRTQYFLAKVIGKSMNTAAPISIQDKDYVLLELTQSAGPEDIVAAVAFDSTGLETATLKRYRMESGRRVLSSESDTEDFFKTMSDKDYIQGVVVAILKPQ